ncbi:hypothetical protein NGUA15_04833 [Salmonella enterica]|nr:hypothetical protein NGUA15_04833 [Salmonella enterica]
MLFMKGTPYHNAQAQHILFVSQIIFQRAELQRAHIDTKFTLCFICSLNGMFCGNDILTWEQGIFRHLMVNERDKLRRCFDINFSFDSDFSTGIRSFRE